MNRCIDTAIQSATRDSERKSFRFQFLLFIINVKQSPNTLFGRMLCLDTRFSTAIGGIDNYHGSLCT